MNKSQSNFRLVYYDFANLNYTSFFLAGFIENAKKYKYSFQVSRLTPKLLLEADPNLKWNDILFSIGLFKVERNKESFYFCIDTRDSNSTNINVGKGFHLPLLNKVKYYFKVNYNRDSVHADPILSKSANKIVPILPFFPIKFNKLFLYLPRFIPSKFTRWNFSDVEKRLKFIMKNLTLEEMINLRNSKKERDIFFLTTYYHGKVHEADNEFRYQLIKEIKKNNYLKVFTGFVGTNLPRKFNEFELDGLRIKQYLAEVAKSKVALYIRGLHDCLSFKFGQYLAMGMPIIGQTIINNRENLMHYDYFNIQFAYDDPKEIVYRAVEMIKQPELLAKLGKSNGEIFDEYFRPQSVVRGILEHII